MATGSSLTVDDVLGRDGLLVRLVADLVGLGGDEVDELRAAVDHQLARVVGHAHVGQSLLDHLVDGGARSKEKKTPGRRLG